MALSASARPALNSNVSATVGTIQTTLRADTNSGVLSWADTLTGGSRARYVYQATHVISAGSSLTLDFLDNTLKGIDGATLAMSRIRAVYIRAETSTSGTTRVNVTSPMEILANTTARLESGSFIVAASQSNSYATLTNATNETITLAVPSGSGSMRVEVIVVGD